MEHEPLLHFCCRQHRTSTWAKSLRCEEAARGGEGVGKASRGEGMEHEPLLALLPSVSTG